MRNEQGYHMLCTKRGNCTGTSDREHTWRRKNPFFPCALGSLPASIKQCGVYVSMALCFAAFLWDKSRVAEHHLPSHPACQCCQPHFIATIMHLITFIMLQLCVCPFTRRRYIYNINEHFHTDNIRLGATLTLT